MATALPRITARVDSATQELLLKATALAGMPSINSFVLNAAVEKAVHIVEREQALKLSESDARLLIAALDQPATVHTKLRKAAEKYDQDLQP